MDSNERQNSTRQFIVALVIVLTGVVFGSWLTLRKDSPGQSQRPVMINAVTNPVEMTSTNIGR